MSVVCAEAIPAAVEAACDEDRLAEAPPDGVRLRMRYGRVDVERM